MKVAIIGFGSIGSRHADNLHHLGHEVSVVEPDPITKEKSSLKGYKTYSTKEEVPIDSYEVVFICTQTNLHINDAIFFADKNKHIFVEKPISYDMDNVSILVNICKKNNLKLMTAANLRFDNGISLVKTLLDNNAINNIYSINYQYGYDLKKWHPDSDYTKSYSAGNTGGASLEDIHSIDLMLYLFGNIKEYIGKLYKSDQLAIQNESVFEAILTTENNISIHIHSNLLNPYRTRILEIYGTNGQIQYDFFDAKVYLRTTDIEETRVFSVCDDINFMFLKEIEYFINCIQQDITPMNDGIQALEIVTKIKENQNKL